MNNELVVGNVLFTPFIGIFTLDRDSIQLLHQEGVWFDEAEIRRAATRAANHVFCTDQLINVVLYAIAAEAFSTLVALPWPQHDVLAEEALQESFFIIVISQPTHDLVFLQIYSLSLCRNFFICR